MTAGVLAIVSVATLCQSSAFVPAYIQPSGYGASSLTLYPPEGKSKTVEIPFGVLFPLTQAPDGKSIYLAPHNPTQPGPIMRIDFRPTRLTRVPGSDGFLTIPHLRVLANGTMFATGCRKTGDATTCGAYKIDPASGNQRLLRAGDWQHRFGEVSADGKRALCSTGDFREPRKALFAFSVVDLESGLDLPLKGVTNGTWSPDGRWLVVVRDDRLELLDAATLKPQRTLGSADGMGTWSPDSKFLVSYKSQFGCTLTLYFQSLAILDISTGKRKVIPSSHCDVSAGPIVWLDPSVLTPANE